MCSSVMPTSKSGALIFVDEATSWVDFSGCGGRAGVDGRSNQDVRRHLKCRCVSASRRPAKTDPPTPTARMPSTTPST